GFLNSQRTAGVNISNTATEGRGYLMYAASPVARQRYLYSAILVLLLSGGVWRLAAQPEKPSSKEGASAQPAPKLDPMYSRWADKKIAFSMDGKPWKQVFAWLTEETELPVTCNGFPQGSFTFIGPPKKTYTIPEIIDIINDALLSGSATQKYVLLLR